VYDAQEDAMYRSILVPLDGSAFGEHALPVARTIARASGATLHLVQVHVPSVKRHLTIEPSIDAGLEAENRKQEHGYLENIVARLGAESDLTCVTALLDGSIADALIAYAETNVIDLVVMTTHGRGGVTRLWLGSIADALARQITVPILLMRPNETPPEITALRTFHRFLELARLLQAECMLLRVVEPLILPRYVSVDYEANLAIRVDESERRHAEQYLGLIAERVEAVGVPIRINVVLEPQPAAGILRTTGEAAIDVIAMATNGRSGLARALIGSVTDKVVRGSEVPVLVYRPRAANV
jgi:nucleotide-binding universal stress UspA family protein